MYTLIACINSRMRTACAWGSFRLSLSLRCEDEMVAWLLSHGASLRRHPGVAGTSVAGAMLCVLTLIAPGASARAVPMAHTDLTTATKPRCPAAQFGAAVAISANTAVIGAPTASRGGAVCIFARSADKWRLQDVLRDPPRGKYDAYGTVVAVSSTRAGTYVMVGASGDGDNSGSVQPDGPVYVYARSRGSWRLMQTLSDPAGYHPGNWFDIAMAMSGTSAVISTQGVSGVKHASYVYVLSGHSWRLQATLRAPRGYGQLAAISGRTVILGSGGLPSVPGASPDLHLQPEDSSGYPDAYVYVRSGSKWHLQAHIADRSHDNVDSEFSLAISGNTALLSGIYVPLFGGSDKGADLGHAFAFRRTGSTWHRIPTINDPGDSSGDFSNGMSISGETAVVGAPEAQNGCGVAYVFTWTGHKWALRTKLVPPGGRKCGKRAYFGWAVSASGNTAIIGAPGTGKTYVLSIP